MLFKLIHYFNLLRLIYDRIGMLLLISIKIFNFFVAKLKSPDYFTCNTLYESLPKTKQIKFR